MAKGVKPRLVIEENQGKSTRKTETNFKESSIEFQAGREYQEKTGDGRQLTVKFVVNKCHLIIKRSVVHQGCHRFRKSSRLDSKDVDKLKQRDFINVIHINQRISTNIHRSSSIRLYSNKLFYLNNSFVFISLD